MLLKQIYEPALAQYAYLVGCQRSGEALIIDPMRDIDRYERIAADNDLKITAVTETHIHADFASGLLEFLATRPGLQGYVSGLGGPDWEYQFVEGRENVQLLKDGDHFKVGNIEITAVHTPGHTPEHLCFLIEDQGGGANEPMGIASGDFVFVGDVGRPDLLEQAAGIAGMQEPSARMLYQSLQAFKELPDYVQVLPGHGAGSACGKALGAVPVSTVGYERRFNSALKTALEQGEEAFVDFILEGQPEPPMYFAHMKKINKEGPPVLGGIPQPRSLRAEEVGGLVGKDHTVILDASRDDRLAFMAKHVCGSLWAPLDNDFPTVAGSFVRAEQEICLLVKSADQVDEAVRHLIRIGLDRVTSYACWGNVAESPALAPHFVATPTAKITDIDRLLRETDEAFVLDVRRKVEFDEGAIPGATNVAHTRLASRMDSLPPRKMLVHCRSGRRAAFAASFLERQGADVVYCDGLFSDWEKQARGESVPGQDSSAKASEFAI